MTDEWGAAYAHPSGWTARGWRVAPDALPLEVVERAIWHAERQAVGVGAIGWLGQAYDRACHQVWHRLALVYRRDGVVVRGLRIYDTLDLYRQTLPDWECSRARALLDDADGGGDFA